MEEKNCKTEEEIRLIIAELQKEKPDYDEDLIRRAIESCCLAFGNPLPEMFIECVKERIMELRVIK